MIRERMQGRNGTLSTRQAEIAGLIASGKSTREIAETLCVSPRTVDTHVGAIFDKLGVRTRVELTALVIREDRVGRGAAGRTQATLTRPALASLVGRDDDVVAIAALLERHRFVTVVGTGGIGKTQVALRVLESGSDAYPDGAYVLELGSLPRDNYVAATLARLLGISLAEHDPIESLTRQLKTKRLLLLLDNCEHLLEGASDVAAAIVKACEGIGILATSREALRVSAERVYRLPTLAEPDATALFLERARSVDDRFVPSEISMPAIAEICRRLDGVPLAIELAAARINHFSPAQILARFGDRFDILRSANKDAPSRHQSMYALIDWSVENLSDCERALFRQLSIFAGAFPLEGAIAVGTADGAAENDVVERLASLIDKSLVMVDRQGDTLRYRLLESTRVFARKKLAEACEHDRTAARHVRYLANRYAAMIENANGFRTQEFVAAFSGELGDIRSALDEAYTRADYEPGAALLTSIYDCWIALSLEREGVVQIEAFLAAVAGRASFVPLSTALVELLFITGRPREANERAAEALCIARNLGDPFLVAEALLSFAATETKIDVVEELLTEFESIEIRSGQLDIWYELRRAWVDSRRQNYARAEDRLRSLLKQSRDAGDDRQTASFLIRLALNEFFRGNLAVAASLSQQSVEAVRSFGMVSTLAVQLLKSTYFLCMVDDVAAADAGVREALTIVASIDPERERVAQYCEGVAFVRALAGDVVTAAQLSAYAQAAYDRTGPLPDSVRAAAFVRVEAILANRCGEAELARLRERGERLTEAEAIELALAHRRSNVVRLEAEPLRS